MRITVKVLLAFLFFSIESYGQNTLNQNQQNFILSAAYGKGTVLPTNPFVKGENLLEKPLDKYQYISLKALWQNPGYSDWQKIYKGPYYGFGIGIGDFYDYDEIGYPISYYGIFGIPVIRFKTIDFYSEFQYGMASNWKHYDAIDNPKHRHRRRIDSTSRYSIKSFFAPKPSYGTWSRNEFYPFLKWRI
ncbi:MAG: hypothetical protein R2771_03670 [Saprospiraceae bacterium]